MTGPITKSVQEIAAALTEKGLRPTQQRIAIYDYLLRHPTHPTVDTIYRAVLERFPTFSRTTIYNSLHALVDAGLIRTVTIEPEEQRFDGNAADHAHFKCCGCGSIYDFDLDDQAVQSICAGVPGAGAGCVFQRPVSCLPTGFFVPLTGVGRNI